MSTYDYMDDLLDEPYSTVVVEPGPVEPGSVEMPAKIEYDLADVSAAAFKQSDLEYQYITRVVDDTKFDKFYGYKTHEARNSHGIELLHQGLEIHERADGTLKFKLFLDIDDKTMMSDEALNEIISVMDEITLCLIHVCRSDRAGKRSLHIVCDVYCSGMKAYQLFLQDMKAALMASKYPEAASAIDAIKSSGTFGLRVPLCFKTGTTDTQLTIITDSTFENFWLQREDYKYPIHEDYNLQEVAAVKHVTHQLLTNDETLATFIDEVDGRFAFNLDHIDLQGKQTQTVKRLAPSYCTACQRKHSNRDGFVAFGPTGTMVLRCSIGGKSPHLHMTLNESKALPEPIIEIEVEEEAVVETPKVEYVKPPMPAPDEHDAMANSPSEDAEIIDSKYNSDVLIDKPNQDLYLISAPGTGKNHYIKGVIEVARKLNPKVKILAITARKTLSIQTCESLSLTIYDKIKGKLNTDFNPQSVFQLESVKRIPADTKFDIILMDEYSLTIAHAYSETGGSDDTNKGLTIMRQLLAICGRSIILDAGITQAQISEVQKIRRSPGRVVLNTHKKWSDCTVDIQTGTYSIAYVRSDLWENTTKQHELMLANQPYNGSLVSCHSLKECRASYTQACEKYGEEHFEMYSSETSEVVKRDDFKHASVAWAGKLIVFFTQTVSCGIEVNIPHFNRTYGFFSNTTTSVDQTIQSLLRGRQVKNIMISYDGRDQYLPQTRRAVIEQCVQAEFNHNIPDSMRSDRCSNLIEYAPELKTTTNADDLETRSLKFDGQLWIGEALAANRSKLYFVGRMKRSFGIIGALVSVTKTQKPLEKSPEIIEHFAGSAAAEAARITAMSENLEQAIDHMEDCLDTNTDVKLQDDATEQQKHGWKALWTARNMATDPRELNKLEVGEREAWLTTYEPVAPIYARVARHQSGKYRDPAGVLYSKSERGACGLSQRVISTLKIDIQQESGFNIPIDRIKGAEISALCVDINKQCRAMYDDGNGMRRSKSNTVASRAGTLNVALGYLGIKLVTVQPSSKKNLPTYRIEYAWRDTGGILDTEQPLMRPRCDHPIRPIY